MNSVNKYRRLTSRLSSVVMRQMEKLMIQFSEEIAIDVVPEKIFDLYADVENWKSWDPDVCSSSISGAFVSGTSGKLKPNKGPEANITITSVENDKSFTVESRLPLCTMIFEHELWSVENTTRVIHRVTFKGPLAFFFGRIIGSQIRKGLPGTLQGLKRASESMKAAKPGRSSGHSLRRAAGDH